MSLINTIHTQILTARKLISLAFLSCCFLPTSALSQTAQRSGDLLDLVEQVRSNMPGRDSEGFVKPSAAQLQAWDEMIQFFLQGDIVAVDSLLMQNLPFYEIYTFIDTTFERRTYFVLQEKNPVGHGWGTYLNNMNFDRTLTIEVPHPRYDLNTHTEGADIFRRTGARYLLMAGTHRCANAEASGCDGSTTSCGDGVYHVSDMAHSGETVLQQTHERINDKYSQIYFVNLHGNGQSNCGDIFLSNGHATLTTPLLLSVRDAIGGGLNAGISGDGSGCTLVGTTNVQGRWTNGSDSPCTEGADNINGRFLHIEQSRMVRDSFEAYSHLIEALNATFDLVDNVESARQTETSRAISGFSLYPNPGTEAVTIRFRLEQERTLGIRIYNTRGELVRILRGMAPAGRGEQILEWHRDDTFGRPVSNGIYFVDIVGEGFRERLRLTIIR